MERNSMIVAGLVTCAVGAAFYALVYPYLSGNIKAQQRTAALLAPSATRGAGVRNANDPAKRRKLIADSLKEVETQSRNKKKATLEQRIAQAGLTLSREAFIGSCAGAGLFFAVLTYVLRDDPLIALGVGVVIAFGAPNWLLSFLCRRRIAKFLDVFPNAVEVIIRGVKAGLPVGDCFRVIASEAQEPVRGEFRRIVEGQAINLSLGEATDRFAERMPVAEASFFAIVINIQQKSGGNLSEALSNLAGVLRDRKRMKGKIKAMSSEAKASAGIVGSLPFLVGGAVYLTNPEYMAVLFTTTPGKMVLIGCLSWMALGVFIMRKMMNFNI
jgi:tight adherence protein B